MKGSLPVILLCLAGIWSYSAAAATEEADRRTVAALDTQYQAAVKHNDADAMARILHKDMILVLGDGRVGSRDDQLQEARDKVILYEIQDEEPGTQSVRVSGDTAVVTARLRVKGVHGGNVRPAPVVQRYIHTHPGGWQYFWTGLFASTGSMNTHWSVAAGK